jgi:deoxyribonuclease IV
MLTTPIGGHAPAAGGLAKAALPYIERTAATAVQVYVSNPRAWARTGGDPRQDEAFRAGCEQREVAVYVHAPLLVNLGSPTDATVEHSVASLSHTLRRGAAIGARAVVFHAGSAVHAEHEDRALHRVGEALLPLLDTAARAGLPRLLVEPSAGGGRCLAARVEQLGAYLAVAQDHPHLGVCFDTCHAWAAGHDLAAPGGMTATLDTLVATVGAHRLELLHANDSKDACGSTRDRHESLGKGTIGRAAFAELTAHPVAGRVPMIVETPSADGFGHAADIALLREAATLRVQLPRTVPVPAR